ncbi:DUF1326 domain-containing protein [Geodermatophilus sp. SYSU D00703]
MTWTARGRWWEACSCKMWCPCWLGPAEPDQGWCSGCLVFDVVEGDSDGVGLRGKVVIRIDWPGDFFSGNGVGRLYLDESATEDQRAQLDAIFSGQRGGHLEGVWQATVTEWLPSQVARIDFQDGDTPSFRVGEVGQIQYGAPMRDPAGTVTTVHDTAAATAFRLGTLTLAPSDGTRWQGSDMREWETLGSGTTGTFDWRSD